VAVIQISKIQVRRGQKNSNSGIPQLSSAEFAWAVDSQELFIGNGSVLEGAPYVGNTKILTEHDNILELASSYVFAETDPSITSSVPRSLQSKLDEYVSVADFGAVGDGSTDCVAAFETAFTQLFRNVNSDYTKVLIVPNGEYLFLSNLRIPSKAIIRGETQHGAILNISSNNIIFITSAGDEVVNFDSTNRPIDVEISNLTVSRTSGQLVLTGVANSTFEKIYFQGEYELGDTVSSLSVEPAAVLWNNTLSGTKMTNNKFKSCTFEANSISLKCIQTAVFDTEIKIEDTKFFVGDTAIYIEGVSGQGNQWQINDSEFEEIANQAFRSTYGQGTLIQRSKFKNCGNGTGTSALPLTPMIYFGEKVGNEVIDASSDRQQAAGIVSSNTTAAVPEVFGSDKTTFVNRNYTTLFLSDSFRPLAVFSSFNKFIIINYFMTLDAFSRVGKLTVSIGDDQQEVSITDEYQYSSPLAMSNGGQLMTNFEFSAEIRDNNDNTTGDSTLGDSTLSVDTVVLSYKNPLATGATGNISFDVTYGV
jgi:hypothetical protein